MKEHLNRLSDEYDRRFSAAGFRSTDDFKAEFFRRARQLPQRHGFRLRHAVIWAGAVAAVLVAGMFLFWRPQPHTVPTTLLAEARRMFEPDGLGVAVVNGELFTFERSGHKPVESLFELNLNPGSKGNPIKIQFVAANGDLVRIDTPWLKGEFWVYKADNNLFTLETNCRIRGQGGKELQICEFTPLEVNVGQVENNGRYIITRKVVPL